MANASCVTNGFRFNVKAAAKLEGVNPKLSMEVAVYQQVRERECERARERESERAREQESARARERESERARERESERAREMITLTLSSVHAHFTLIES